MVYFDSWDEFVDRSVQLFRADPITTRYVMKYRHCDGKLVLKVTDDRVENTSCRGYLSDCERSIFQNKMQKMYNSMNMVYKVLHRLITPYQEGRNA